MAEKVVLLAVYFLSLGELEQVLAAPLSLHAQYQAALQQVAELKKDCCDVSHMIEMLIFATFMHMK